MNLTENDVKFVVSRLPADVRTLIEESNGRICVAGGFIRAVIANEEPSDVDLFGDNAAYLRSTARRFADSRVVARSHASPNAVSVITPDRLTVQFITRWVYAANEDVISSFDFTVCAVAIWHKNGVWQSACSDRFYQDLAARRLHYTSPVRDEEVGGSMLRVIKYLKRGYVIQVDSLGAVIGRIVQHVKVDTSQDIASEDIQRVVTGLLREVDPGVSMNDISVAVAGTRSEVTEGLRAY